MNQVSLGLFYHQVVHQAGPPLRVDSLAQDRVYTVRKILTAGACPLFTLITWQLVRW